jgi:hypothetical protein
MRVIAATLATATLGIGAAQAQTTTSQPNPDVLGTLSAQQQLRAPSVSEQTFTSIDSNLLLLEQTMLLDDQAQFDINIRLIRTSETIPTITGVSGQ